MHHTRYAKNILKISYYDSKFNEKFETVPENKLCAPRYEGAIKIQLPLPPFQILGWNDRNKLHSNCTKFCKRHNFRFDF